MSKSSDIKLSKINSFNKLKEENKKQLLTTKNKYTYAILPGNNQKISLKVMEQTSRAKYWENSTHLYVKGSTKNAV